MKWFKRYAGPPQPWRYEHPKTEVFVPEAPFVIEVSNRYLRSIDGVEWNDAPRPPRRHRCWPQTRALGHGRCPCGAFQQYPGAPWIDRNSRKGK